MDSGSEIMRFNRVEDCLSIQWIGHGFSTRVLHNMGVLVNDS